MQFAPSFLSLPLAALEVLESNGHEFVGGLFYGSSRFHKQLCNHPVCEDTPILYPDELEIDWIRSDLDRSCLERIRNTYGDENLQKLILGDRHLGYGNTTGANITPTSLTIAVRRNGPDSIWQYLVSLISAIEAFYDRTKPDLIVQHAVADAVRLAMNMVAEKRGIRNLVLFHGRIGPRYLMAPLGDMAADIVAGVEGRSPVSEESETFARGYLEDARALKSKPEYSVRARERARKQSAWSSIPWSLAKMASGILDKSHDTPHSSRFHNGMAQALKPYRFRRENRILRSLVGSCGQGIDESYALMPLQVEPEASTLIYAPDHIDQFHTAFEISHSLPFGMKLYVKEHVPMIGRRPSGYYKRLSRIPGVVMIDPWIDSQPLIKAADLVLTPTGTAAFEAAVQGVPAVMFGTNFYSHMREGITNLDDHESLREAINHALGAEPASDQYLLKFIAALHQSSFPLNSAMIWTRLANTDCRETKEAGEALANYMIARHLS